MIRHHFLWSSCVIASFAFISGCGFDTPQQQGRRVPDNSKYTDCIDPHAGAYATYVNLNRNEIVSSQYFGKPFDEADLDAVLEASATETGAYVRRLNVSVFRMPSETSNGCPTFYHLQEAPGELQDVWNQAVGQGGGNGQLAGLYFEYRVPDSPDVVNPTILVLEDLDRWTLIHEMMHHNFNVQRKQAGNYIPHEMLKQLRAESLERVRGLTEEYQATSNGETLAALVNETNTAFHLTYEQFLRRNFEEMAIESMLTDAAVAGKMTLFAPTSLDSAAWYIEESSREPQSRFNDLGMILNYARNEANFHGWNSTSTSAESALAEITTALKSIDDTVNGAKAKVAQARNQHPIKPTNGPQRPAIGNFVSAAATITHPESDLPHTRDDFSDWDGSMTEIKNHLGLD